MSPALFYCTQQCLSAGEPKTATCRLTWDEMKLPQWDPPEEIVQGIMKAQEQHSDGYKAHPKTDPQKFREALPTQTRCHQLNG